MKFFFQKSKQHKADVRLLLSVVISLPNGPQRSFPPGFHALAWLPPTLYHGWSV